MSDTFHLRGSDKPRKGRATGTWVVLALLGLSALGLVLKALYSRPAGSGSNRTETLLRQAEARKEALIRLLPGARLPEPFYLRGAASGAGTSLVWMLRDYDQTHAFLIGAESVPEAATLAPLLADMGGERMPPRQRIDEPGVLPERRPPFVEEYRTDAVAGDLVPPPRGWTEQWDEAVKFQFPDGRAAGLELRLDADTAFPLSPWRRDSEQAWCVVDLSARDGAGRLFLVYMQAAHAEPTSGTVHDFLGVLLAARE